MEAGLMPWWCASLMSSNSAKRRNDNKQSFLVWRLKLNIYNSTCITLRVLKTGIYLQARQPKVLQSLSDQSHDSSPAESQSRGKAHLTSWHACAFHAVQCSTNTGGPPGQIKD
eukprot:927802-Pelagomonas_calceolata.AAC.4